MPVGTPPSPPLYRGNELALKKAEWDAKAEARRLANKGTSSSSSAPAYQPGYVIKEGDTAESIAKYMLGGGASQEYIKWYASEIESVLFPGRGASGESAFGAYQPSSILQVGTRFTLPEIQQGKTVNGQFIPTGSQAGLPAPAVSSSIPKPAYAPSYATAPGQWMSKAGAGWVWMQWSDRRGWYEPQVGNAFK